MYYFTGDLHWGSDDILFRENRPFANINDFIDFCIVNWNIQLTKDDVLWILGDFVNYNNHCKLSKDELSKILGIVKRLNCKIILIIGNGEERIIEELFNNNFEKFKSFCISAGITDVMYDAIIKMKGRKFYINHYPHKHRQDMLNLFAHTHRVTGLWKPYGLNLGCDLNHFRLFSETEVLRLIELKEKWWDVDVDNLSM